MRLLRTVVGGAGAVGAAPALIVGSALFALGCGGTPRPSPGPAEAPREDAPTGRAAGPRTPAGAPLDVVADACVERPGDEVTRLDLNGDGREDVIAIARGGVALCRRIDLNFDGQHDIVRFFDPEGRTTREGMDLDFDGRIDIVSTDDGDATGMDTDFDGRPDTWRIELGDGAREERRDLDGDGRVDFWRRTDPQGTTTWTSEDRDGDGAPDRPAP